MSDIAELYRKLDRETRDRADSAAVSDIIAGDPATTTMRAFRVEQLLSDLTWHQQQRVLSLFVHRRGHTLIIDGLPIPAEE